MTEDVIILIVLFVFAFAIASVPLMISYILGSIGKMRLLRSLGYKKPFIAFIPFARNYALGWMAQQLETGRKEKKHGLLYTVISALASVTMALYYVLYFSLMIFSLVTSSALAADDSMPFGPDYFYNQISTQESEEAFEMLAGSDEKAEDEEKGEEKDKDSSLGQDDIEVILGLLTVAVVLIIIPANAISIAQQVYGYILFNKVHKIFDRKNATLFTALTLGVNYLLSIDIFGIMLFVLSIRKKVPYNIRPTSPEYPKYCHLYYTPAFGMPYRAPYAQPYAPRYAAPYVPQYGAPVQIRPMQMPPQYGAPVQMRPMQMPPQYGAPMQVRPVQTPPQSGSQVQNPQAPQVPNT